MFVVLTALGWISAVYLVIGVFVTAKFYPGYSHKQQFMSELAAIGSPTEKLSPRINNYPLALMFCLFGISFLMLDGLHLSELIAGASIVLHGIATAIAGYFRMDKDPYIEQPSSSGQIHGIAGMLVMLSLYITPIALSFSPRFGLGFQVFSGLCVLASVYFTWKTMQAFEARNNAGLYQRLSYGLQLFWLAGLSLYLLGL